MDRINISFDTDLTDSATVDELIADAAEALGMRVETRSQDRGPLRQSVSFGGRFEDPDPKAIALIVAETLDTRLRKLEATRLTVSTKHMLVLSF